MTLGNDVYESLSRISNMLRNQGGDGQLVDIITRNAEYLKANPGGSSMKIDNIAAAALVVSYMHNGGYSGWSLEQSLNYIEMEVLTFKKPPCDLCAYSVYSSTSVQPLCTQSRNARGEIPTCLESRRTFCGADAKFFQEADV